MNSLSSQQRQLFDTLRRFARRPPARHCDLCRAELASEHSHLVEPASRRLLCACEACAILFNGQPDARFRRVPRRILYPQEFQMTDALWEGLRIPIQMAFFFHSTPAHRIVALYPSPAGAAESLVDPDAWEHVRTANPVLDQMEPDVEALLVHRVAAARDHFIVPIDECFKLVGLLRSHWKGLSGGPDAWQAIGQFFARLKERADA